MLEYRENLLDYDRTNKSVRYSVLQVLIISGNSLVSPWQFATAKCMG